MSVRDRESERERDYISLINRCCAEGQEITHNPFYYSQILVFVSNLITSEHKSSYRKMCHVNQVVIVSVPNKIPFFPLESIYIHMRV